MSQATSNASVTVKSWNEDRDVLTMADGSEWGTRRIIDPQRRELYRKGETRFPQSTLYFPLLEQFSRNVRTYKAKHEPRTIRKMMVNSPRPHGRDRIGVWHLGDIAAVNEWRANADRQQAETGEFRGRWFISPGTVAERLGVDISSIPRYKRHGIPWMPKIAKGCKAGQKRKPITESLMLGNGRYHDFWFESDVDEFANARMNLSDELPDGYKAIGEAKKGHVGATRAIADGNIPYVEIPIKKMEKVDGKREFAFTTIIRAVPTDRLDDLHEERINNPVPADMMTVKQIAAIFPGTSETEVSRWISEGCRELHGATLKADWGPILCPHRRNGRLRSQIRGGWRVKIKLVERIWKARYPNRPWPIAEGGHGAIRGLLREELRDHHREAVAPEFAKLGALGEAAIIVTKKGNAATQVIVTEGNASVIAAGKEGVNELQGTLANAIKTMAPSTPTIFHHADRSYSLDGLSPKTVSAEEHAVLVAFAKADKSLTTKELEQACSNVSRVMGRIIDKFPGAALKNEGKGEGYYARVRPVRTK